MLNVIAYTGGPSGVFRVRQYVQPLRQANINLRECASTVGSHPPVSKWLRPGWGLWNLAERAIDTMRSSVYDVVLFQREMFSTFVTWEPLAKRPRIFDIDDAIWIHRRGDFARRLARLCDHVICGNRFLAQQFSQWNPEVSILPTAVDIHAFSPAAIEADPERPIIGWMGLPVNLGLLYGVQESLAEVLRRHPNAVLRVVSSEPPRFTDLPADRIEYIRWTPQNEATSIQNMTVGIMPLDDTLFSRGKCAFKMLLYMACGLPVVVSPVGMNSEVLEQGAVGFGAVTESDWVEHMDTLLRDRELRKKMGATGRQVVERHYSVESLAPRLAKIISGLGGQ